MVPGLRGDGEERLVEEMPQMGSDLLASLSLFGDKRYLLSLFVGKFILYYQHHHVNRRLDLETCREKDKYKIFSQIAILPRRN